MLHVDAVIKLNFGKFYSKRFRCRVSCKRSARENSTNQDKVNQIYQNMINYRRKNELRIDSQFG